MRVVGLIARLLELGAAVALCALLFVSAGREDGRVSVERLSDIVPIKVVVSDFASLDDGGTHALYRIRGSAMLKVPVDRAEIMDLGNGAVAVKRMPVPSVDDRSVRFEPGGVELLDAERGWFTTVSGAAKKGISVSEDADGLVFGEEGGPFKLSANMVNEVTNITYDWLPATLDLESQGSHNGRNYLAYTFYLRNTGDKNLDYNTVMRMTGSSKSADEAVRFMIYKNGKASVYAKGRYNNRKEAETDATKWVDEEVIINDASSPLKAGATDKYTVVIWCEGNDRECVDAIRGGHVRANLTFNVVPDPTAPN